MVTADTKHVDVELLAVPDRRHHHPGRRVHWRFCGDTGIRAELDDRNLIDYATDRFDLAKHAYGWQAADTAVVTLEQVTERGRDDGQCPWPRTRMPHRHVVVAFVNLAGTAELHADQWALVREPQDIRELSEVMAGAHG